MTALALPVSSQGVRKDPLSQNFASNDTDVVHSLWTDKGELVERQVAGEVHFDETYSTFSFDDGLTVSLLSCPRMSMARAHWRDNGICDCRKAKAS